MLPALAAIFVVVLFPLTYSLWLSFTDVNLLRTTGPAIELFGVRVPLFRWIGLRNYLRIVDDPLYWSSLWRTLYFVGAFVLEATLIGMGMALVLHERFRGRPVMRSLLLIPWSLSRVVVGLLWIGILDFEFGMLNGVLARLGLIDGYISFLRDGFTALNVLVSVYMWNQAPFATLLFLAGMQSISTDLYSAAEVDGAGYWQRVRRVIFPLTLRTVLLVTLVSVIGSLLAFDQFYIMTAGQPSNETATSVFFVYLNSFPYLRLGYGAALSLVLAVTILAFTIVQMVLTRRSNP